MLLPRIQAGQPVTQIGLFHWLVRSGHKVSFPIGSCNSQTGLQAPLGHPQNLCKGLLCRPDSWNSRPGQPQDNHTALPALSSCWKLIKINTAVCCSTPPGTSGVIRPHNFSGESGTEIQPQRPRWEALNQKPTRTGGGRAYLNLSGWVKDKYLSVSEDLTSVSLSAFEAADREDQAPRLCVFRSCWVAALPETEDWQKSLSKVRGTFQRTGQVLWALRQNL